MVVGDFGIFLFGNGFLWNFCGHCRLLPVAVGLQGGSWSLLTVVRFFWVLVGCGWL